MMVVAQNAIGYPDQTWVEVSRHAKRIGTAHHADSVALPLWTMQELNVMHTLHTHYLLELRLGNLGRMERTWQSNWLTTLIECCCTYRTTVRWYGKEMNRALTYEKWLVHELVALVVVAESGSTYHAGLVAAAYAIGVPTYRVDPDSFQAYRLIEPTTKEKKHGS